MTIFETFPRFARDEQKNKTETINSFAYKVFAAYKRPKETTFSIDRTALQPMRIKHCKQYIETLCNVYVTAH